MRSVLLTGATTPVGRAILRALARSPAVEHVVAIGAEPAGAVTFDVDDPTRVSYLNVDLTRPRGVHSLLFGPARDLGVETIVHTALHRSARDAGPRIRALNVESTRALLHLSRRHPTVRRFVFRSSAAVYRVENHLPTFVDEDQPLDLSPRAPEWVRDRVEADLTVCALMGAAQLQILVLRCAECLAPASASQLWDYLSAPLCLRPLGYDPMLNLLSAEDLAAAVRLATLTSERGVFNVPGRDTLPLSEAIRKSGRVGVPVPGPWLGPLYGLRAAVRRRDFRYDLNRDRMHLSHVLDGSRARAALGYVPEHPIRWPATPG